jgi:hypothetical protein
VTGGSAFRHCLFGQHEKLFANDIALFNRVHRDLAQRHLSARFFLRHLDFEAYSEPVWRMDIGPVRVELLNLVCRRPNLTFRLDRDTAPLAMRNSRPGSTTASTDSAFSV